MAKKTTSDNKEDLGKWLKSKDKNYEEGVRLYSKYGKNRNLMNTFNRKHSSFTADKLEYELKKIYEDDSYKIPVKSTPVLKDVKSHKQVVSKQGKQKAEKKGSASSDDTAKLLESLETQKTGIFNKKGILSNKLQEAKSDKERQAILKDIEKLEAEADKVNKKIESVKTTGALPQEGKKKKELPTDPAKLQRELTNARSRISKNKVKAEQWGDSPKGEEVKKKIAEDEKLIKEIESKLN
jgi:hypothetical protein